MRGSFLKGAVVGLVCALIGGATVALAGSGVGGVFNLGQTNSVDAKTTLTGASPGIQLQVTNTNGAGKSGLAVTSASGYPTGTFTNSDGGSAGAFAVSSGVAPFTVSSQTKVTNLNADLVDGFHVNQIMSGGGRIAQASAANLGSAPSDVQATVTLTAPNAGFVLVQGSIVAEDYFAAARCNTCTVFVRVLDVSANDYSVISAGTIGNGTSGEYLTIPVQWVFPVTAGSHSYKLLTALSGISSGGPAVMDNPVLTAEFIPFGHSGSSTILAPDGENTVATRDQTNTDGVSRAKP